jgi:hypothetical protein
MHREAVEAMDMLSDWPLRFLDQTFVFMLHQGSAQPQMETDDSNTKGDRETRTSDYLLQCALEVCLMTRHVSSSSYDMRVVRSRGMLDADGRHSLYRKACILLLI